MASLNFSPQFAPLVERREKTQTIRRGDRIRPGQRLQLYRGMRTKACRKIVTPDPVCIDATYVELTARGVTLGDKSLFPRDIDEFARLDGFDDYAAMWAWFSERYKTTSFTGQVVRWAF